ncbi:MAG TPA: hypothetical protein VGX00_08425 [Thermoplasmata archaeon]|nr:hypothetical protein [Thermoplasmata archaeon]
MADLSETPAVAPEPSGGNDRAGMQIAGALLIVLGFGLGVFTNIYLHAIASATGSPFGPWTIHPILGPYAWATVILGTFSGLVGIGLVWVARGEPKGPVRLPGAPL